MMKYAKNPETKEDVTFEFIEDYMLKNNLK